MITQILDYIGYLIFTFVTLQTIYSLIIFLIVLVISLLLRKRSPHLNILLWSLVFVRFVLPPQYATPFSLRSLWETGKSVSIPLERAQELHQLILPALSSPVLPGIPLLSWHVLIVLGWLGGFVILSIRFYSKRAWFKGLMASAEIIDHGIHKTQLEQWKKHFNVRRDVILLGGNVSISPFTYGVRRPRIYLPNNLREGLDSQDVEVLIAHEMAHISRFDDFWLRIQRFIQQLFFFNPIIWICNRQIENQRELICDKMVVSQGSISASRYGKTMLQVLQHIHHKREHTGVAGYVSEHGFYRERLLELLAQKPITSFEKTRNFLISLAMLLVVLPLAPTQQQAVKHHELALQLASQVKSQNIGPNYLRPLPEMKVVHPYGLRKSQIPFFGSQEFHTGVDLASPVGTEVRAVADGVVEIARAGPMDSISVSTGGYLVIRHDDGNKSVYVHVNPVTVKKGDRVAAGAPLGMICPVFDIANLKSNAYLHFEIIKDDIRINPELFMPIPSKQPQ